ncbi:MAG: hypothetical protein ACREF3_06785 [Acetobacteraceae bacterium]
MRPFRSLQSPAGQQRLIQWATLLAGVSLMLVIVNIVLATIVQNAQAEVNRRQQMIAQAAQLGPVTAALVRDLVAQSATDTKLQDLLKQAGITQSALPAAPKP